jgi:hypothetical protein
LRGVDGVEQDATAPSPALPNKAAIKRGSAVGKEEVGHPLAAWFYVSYPKTRRFLTDSRLYIAFLICLYILLYKDFVRLNFKCILFIIIRKSRQPSVTVH